MELITLQDARLGLHLRRFPADFELEYEAIAADNTTLDLDCVKAVVNGFVARSCGLVANRLPAPVTPPGEAGPLCDHTPTGTRSNALMLRNHQVKLQAL